MRLDHLISLLILVVFLISDDRLGLRQAEAGLGALLSIDRLLHIVFAELACSLLPQGYLLLQKFILVLIPRGLL